MGSKKKYFNDEISYTCKWPCHSRCSKFRAAGKSTKELAASKVTSHKYVAFVHERLFTLEGNHLHWQTCWQWSFEIWKTTLQLELTLQLRLAVNQVKSIAFKHLSLCAHHACYFCTANLHRQKFYENHVSILHSTIVYRDVKIYRKNIVCFLEKLCSTSTIHFTS